MIVALAGGVGGARLAYGLSRCLPADRLLIGVNTGDDFDHLGLRICPDIDTVCYALAELDDVERGWGRSDESWQFMSELRALGGPDWFNLGDRDLAKHIMRTHMLADGLSLSKVTALLAKQMGVAHRIVPMSDDSVPTIVHTEGGPLAFQDYFVRQKCAPVVTGLEYHGAMTAVAQPKLLAALASDDLEALIICPSNPWLSIGPILAIPSISDAVKVCRAPRILVSPIVGGAAIKGPAAKLMREMNIEVSALGVARHYHGVIDCIVIDHVDADLVDPISDLGITPVVTNSVMESREGRIRFARDILTWAGL